MFSGEAERNICAAVGILSLHSCNFDCNLSHIGTAQARDNPYTFPEDRHWKSIPILLESQAADTMTETARTSSCMHHSYHCFHYTWHGQTSGKHKLQWVSTTGQVADIGMKNISFPNLKPRCISIFIDMQV